MLLFLLLHDEYVLLLSLTEYVLLLPLHEYAQLRLYEYGLLLRRLYALLQPLLQLLPLRVYA